MSRLIIKYSENEKPCFVNITADKIEERESIIFAYAKDNLVGVFDLGMVDAAYLSEEGGR